MVDFSQLLTQRAEVITEQWLNAVEQDHRIPTADHLSRTAIRDHIPHVLEALTTVLSHFEEDDVETIARASLKHGSQRAEQGFEPTEIAREYHLLRSTILNNLREGLLKGSTDDALRAVYLINAVVDAALAECFRSYVNQRLEELEHLHLQLSLNNQELERLLQISQSNLSHLAHELKTPLNSIIGYSQLFIRQHQRTEVKDSVPNLEHIERVLRNGRQLLRLINDSLELARYDAGEMELQLVETDIPGVIQTVVELIQPLATSRGLELIVDCERCPRPVLTNPLRLQQILTNLASNAVRYTETGRITIRCEAIDAQFWQLIVCDTGMGIPAADQARIFEPFFRVPSADPANSTESTGLGLAIVQRLVKLLQGEISLVSILGSGSTFTIKFPIKPIF
ncbi:MAG: HAMP domain-containing histidine kinase [Elainella sp. Prado103]|jgi:signal transduction histidine kinase|nr:HAMP domain-containing histidine kinase [Elainella sp. Prado103]